jgi:hypothetical protein
MAVDEQLQEIWGPGELMMPGWSGMGDAVAVTATDWVPDEQSDEFIALDERQTRTKMVSFTDPGFMLTVIWLEPEIVGEFPVFQTPEPAPCPHLNCTMFPFRKLLPLMVRVCCTPSAFMVAGLMLVTDGTGTVAETATD